MATSVWKFELGLAETEIDMPQHARVLSCAFQNDRLMVWAVVTEGNKAVKHRFYVTGTGQSCRANELNGWFVGTAFIGRLVFHVFDLGEVGELIQ